MKVNDIKIDKIIRSKRKTISIKIDSGAEVIVYAPGFMSNYDLHRAIHSKYDWIKKHRSDMLDNKVIKHKYEEGEIFYFLGEEFRLKYNNKSYIRLDEENKVIEIDADCNKAYVIKEFYKNLAKHYVLKIAYEVSDKLKKSPKIYRISSAEKRWGSCSTNGNINLSYKLLMCRRKFIEYVVIHELAHLKEHNHSQRFWNYVEEMMPDYRNQLIWIKNNQYKFQL